MKKTIVFDFDGVIHIDYDQGYKDGSIYGKINYELLEYMKELMKDYYVVISSNRPAKQIVDFLNADENVDLNFELYEKDFGDNLYWLKDDIIGVTNAKAIGKIYIDDKGYRYKDLKNLKNDLKGLLGDEK